MQCLFLLITQAGVRWRAAGWLLALLILGIGTPVQAGPAPIAVLSDTLALRVTPHVEWLEDPSRSLSLQQVRAQTQGWSRPPSLTPGFSRSVWWVRLRVDNPGEPTRRLVLDLREPLQDDVDWFVLDGSGALLAQHASGDRRPFAERPLRYRNFALPLDLPPGQQREVLIRLDSHDGLFESLDPVLYSAEAFRAASARSELTNGLYFGALIALALYNLIVWFSTRERVFGLYALYAVCFLAWGFTYCGFTSALIWPESPALTNVLLPIAATMSIIGSARFGMCYLRLAERAPRWQWRGCHALMALHAITIPLALSDHYAWAFAVCIPTGLALIVFFMMVAVHQLRRKSREALFYLLSFSPLAVSTIVVLLRLVDLLPQGNPGRELLWQAGSAVEMLLLAVCVADSRNQLKAQMLAAERTARGVQEQAAVLLEAQVKARTLELQAANQRLGELTITDALTGAFNRRHFDERCAALLQARRRHLAPLAFCMIDIDHFKPYNDHHGHQQGDRALCAVVTALRSRLRRDQDELFRLGGEEFGLLFSTPTAAEAAALAEGLRYAIQALELPHAAAATRTLTASFGLLYAPAGTTQDLTLSTLYDQADRLLYEAKSAGRNRVVMKAFSATP